MIARRGKRPVLHVALQATKPLNAVPANAGASTVVGSILLPTLVVKPERNGPWPTASGPKPTCLGQWPSSKQRSWWEPQGIRRWLHQQRGTKLCPLSLQPGGRTSHWTQGGATPPSWLPGRPPNQQRVQSPIGRL